MSNRFCYGFSGPVSVSKRESATLVVDTRSPLIWVETVSKAGCSQERQQWTLRLQRRGVSSGECGGVVNALVDSG